MFEVLSQGTDRFDRTDKANDHKTLSSLRDYVLIESEKARVQVFSRLHDGRWAQSVTLPGAVALVPSVEIELSLEDLYEDAVLSTTPPPFSDDV